MGAHSVKTREVQGNQEKDTAAKRKLSNILVPVILVLAGLAVLLYPVIATQWNNVQHERAADEYAKLEQATPREILDSDMASAQAYNATLGGTDVADPWSHSDDVRSQAYKEYAEQLATFPAMARIVVPEANVNLPVYHGTSHEVLQKGVGHLFGTDLPVGGESRHAVMTGHTGLQDATLFDNLTKVEEGDAIYIQAAGQKMKYKVYDTEVVLPDEVESLQRVEGKDLVTLITCTPYGINSHRLLVHAERAPLDPSDEQYFEDSGFHLQWWMWAIIAASILVLILLGWWIYRMWKGSKKS